MNVASALFMKLAISLVIGLTVASSSILWHMSGNWMLGTLYNLVLAVMMILYRGRIYGAVVGAFDGIQAAARRSVDDKPTAGYLGGAVADATRRKMSGMVLAGAAAVIGAPIAARAALGNLQMRRLASESLLRRYTLEKDQARIRPGGQPSEFVQAADLRRSQGLLPFSPEQVQTEAARLEGMRNAGEDPRSALLKPGEDPNRSEFPLVQARFDQQVAAEKAIMDRQRPRTQMNVQAATRLRTPVGRLAGMLGRVRSGFRRRPLRQPLWSVSPPPSPRSPQPPPPLTPPPDDPEGLQPPPGGPARRRPPVWELPLALPNAAGTGPVNEPPAEPIRPLPSAPSPPLQAQPLPDALLPAHSEGPVPSADTHPPSDPDLPKVGRAITIRGRQATVRSYHDLEGDQPYAQVDYGGGNTETVPLGEVRGAVKPPKRPPPATEE